MPPAPPLPPRKRLGIAELNRIAAAGGYENDVPGYLDSLEDMALGIQQICQGRRSGAIDEWGFVAHVKNYGLAMDRLLQGATQCP